MSEDERDHFAVRIARIGYHLLQIRKKDALQNLSIAFPEKSIEERISILKRTYAFFSRSFLQFLAIKKSFRFVKINTIDHELLDEGLEKGKGVILATAHFSKWEVMSTWLGNHDYPCIAVAQKQKNVGADIFFRELRQETGMGMIYRKSAIKHMYRILAENKILNDNGLRNRDEFVSHKILDCLGDLMLSGHRIFGHIKTSQGGHQLTNVLLKEFLSDKSNWEFESLEKKENNQKDGKYLRPIAVNA